MVSGLSDCGRDRDFRKAMVGLACADWVMVVQAGYEVVRHVGRLAANSFHGHGAGYDVAEYSKRLVGMAPSRTGAAEHLQNRLARRNNSWPPNRPATKSTDDDESHLKRLVAGEGTKFFRDHPAPRAMAAPHVQWL